MRPTCSVLILNHNGRGLLESYLPSVIEAVERARLARVRVVVVDNQSTDGSSAWVKASFPQVDFLLAPANRFLLSLNWAGAMVDSELLMFLNNDVEMDKGSLDPLVDSLLVSQNIFSVTPQMYSMDRGSLCGGCWVAGFSRGNLEASLKGEVQRTAPTLFSSGGAMLVRRSDFLYMGGFDDLYYPAYWEDIDLCYRAWKQGRSSICQPESVVYHVQSASTASDASFRSKRTRMIDRNRWLFIWRNVSEAAMLLSNAYWTSRHYASLLRRRQWYDLGTYRDAFALWSKAIAGRHHANRNRILSDSEIIECVAVDSMTAPEHKQT